MITRELDDSQLVLRLQVTAESVGVARRAAAQLAAQAGCRTPLLWRVRLAVSESVTNVLVHAHRDNGHLPHEVTVRARVDEHRVEVEVADDGSGMLARTDSPGMGLGLGAIAQSCYELSLEDGPAGGLTVRMTFLR